MGYTLELVSGNEKNKPMTAKDPLSVTHPDLAKQAVGWDPSQVATFSNLKMAWKCDQDHVWEAVVGNRTFKGYGCPVCSGQKILSGFNDLATLHPEIALEAHNWDATKVAAHSNRKLEWRCNSGHLWKSTVTNRVRRGDGCAVCSNHQTLRGFNDLATTDPELVKEVFEWDPTTLNRSSNKKVGWVCQLGHTWYAPPASRVSGSGCPTCSGRVVLFGFNDLQTSNPELATQADGWDPKTVTKSSNRVLAWCCDKGHSWKTSVGNRTSGKGCPVCTGQKVLVGFNDLASTNPELSIEAYGWDPKTVTIGSTKKNTNQWRCNLGHIWKATVALRSAGGGCPVCAGQKVFAGYNDLATTHPHIAAQAHNWDPSTVMAGTDKRLAWKCEFGHVWKVRGADRMRGSGCPSCAESGFDPNKDAFLYFLSHPNWEMLQIGITNVPEVRFKKHRRLGWEVLELRGPMDGHLTQQWETAMLRMLKAKGADLSNGKIAGKFDGYSEAWSKSAFEARSIKELMRLTEEFEEGKA
ncbi:MAG: hypothetical protein D4R83_05510 [Streptomycetaceae bacterium]|nr:MAG: hypothetical protein D4R83_05510 [Streptomycetaceae bacterium]